MGLFPKNLNEYVASLGIPRGPKSKAFLVDTVNGSDSNPGTTWEAPLKSLTAAEDLCTANRHDTVLWLAGATADNPTTMITWDKNYTHLIGIGNPVYGMGQRCRLVSQAAAALTVPLTISGSGCIIKNIQVYNEKASGASGCIILSGSRCYLEGVFAMTPVSVTAASYSLKVTGAENTFVRCTIGQQTNVRTAASYGLWLEGTGSNRNKFVKCEFLSWSSVTTHALVKYDADAAGEAQSQQFEDCLFHNFPGSGEAGGLLAAGIVDSNATFHQILLRGDCDFAGCTAVANPLTYVLVGEHSGTASGLLMATVNES